MLAAFAANCSADDKGGDARKSSNGLSGFDDVGGIVRESGLIGGLSWYGLGADFAPYEALTALTLCYFPCTHLDRSPFASYRHQPEYSCFNVKHEEVRMLIVNA